MIFFKILWNEFKKEFFNTWSYRWQWIYEFISLFAFFFFLNMFAGQAETGIAYCIWFYSVLIIGDVSGKVSSEMRAGTFEQLYLSSVSIPILFLSKAITSICRALIIVTLFLMLFGVFGYVTLSFLNYKIIYILISITPGLFGISLFIGGMTILFKDTNWLINIINNSFLFLSGIFLPLNSLSEEVQKIALILPVTQAIKALNQSTFFTTDLMLMTITNICYFTIGLCCFYLFEKRAKMKGVLGYY